MQLQKEMAEKDQHDKLEGEKTQAETLTHAISGDTGIGSQVMVLDE